MSPIDHDDDDLLPDDIDLDAELARGDEASPLRRMVAEARDAQRGLLPRGGEFSLAEQKLLLRLETERAIQKRERRTQIFSGVAMSLALAAGTVFLLARQSAPPPERTEPVALAFSPVGGPSGGNLRTDSNDPAGFVVGDIVEVADQPIVFESKEATAGLPRRAIFALDPAGEKAGTRVKVQRSVGTLVLALERGAVEADVTPVRNGEAFAIDVAGPSGTTRVAVHGTHLRVAKKGNLLTVDLTEGVIALGAPGEGRTQGREIHAPAHVELEAGSDPAAAKVGTEPRAAWPLDMISQGRSPSRPLDFGPTASAPATSPSAVPSVKRPGTVTSGAPASAPSSVAPPVAALAEGPARAAIQVDVKRCAVQTTPPGGAVSVHVESTLTVDVREDGSIAATRFDPPLAPAMQTCAANAVLARRIEGPRTLTVPIKFEY